MKYILIATMLAVVLVSVIDAQPDRAAYLIYGPLTYQSNPHEDKTGSIHTQVAIPDTSCDASITFQRTIASQNRVNFVGKIELLDCTDKTDQQRFTGKGRIAFTRNDASDLMAYLELK